MICCKHNYTSETKSVISQIEKLKKIELEKIAKSQKFLKQVKEDEVIWSTVINDIKILTPEGVNYSSYVGTEAKEININVETDSVDKVIEAIKSYTKAEKFGEVFVPSVNKGITTEGEKLYSFSINTSYTK